MFLYIMRRMVRARNSTMSPEFRLNSPFHSVPVKGDYKLSKKNEILVDLFLNTLFHAVPPQSPLPPFRSFLSTKFARSFHFFFSSVSAPLPTGSLRVEVRSEATWLGHVAERDQPGNKGLCCWRSVARCQTFTFTPSPPASVWRKPLQGCFNGGLWALSPLRQQSLDAVMRRVTLGTHQRGKRWEIKGGDAPLLRLADKDLYGRRIIGRWAASFGCQDIFCESVWLWSLFLLVQKQIFNRLIKHFLKKPNWNNTLWNEMKAYWFLSATDVLKILHVEFCR